MSRASFVSGGSLLNGLHLRNLFLVACQRRANLARDKIDSNVVETAFRNDNVRVPFRGLDKLKVHRPDDGRILADDRFDSTAALVNIAIKAANESNIGVGVDKNLKIHQAPQLRIRENEDAFEYHHRPRLEVNSFRFAETRSVVINRLVYRLTGAQCFEMIDQQLGVERIRMIEVESMAKIERHVAEVSVIGVLGKKDDVLRSNFGYDFFSDRSLSRTRAAADSNNHARSF